MKKVELVESVAEKAGLTKADATRAIDAFVETISETLAKGDKIHRVFQDLSVLRSDDQRSIIFLQQTLQVAGVASFGLNLQEDAAFLIQLHDLDDIVGIRGVGIIRNTCDHASNLVLRVNLMSQLCRRSRGHQFVVRSLHFIAKGECFIAGMYASAEKRMIQNGVDFVKCQPIFHLALIALEYRPAIVQEKVNRLPAAPAVIGLCEMKRCFIMRKGDHRLNAISPAHVKKPVIKLQSRFIGGLIISVWIYSGPGFFRMEMKKNQMRRG